MIDFFLLSEKRLVTYIMMSLSVFKNWFNNVVILDTTASSMLSISAEYYLPLYFQSVKQASPLCNDIMIVSMMITEATVTKTVSVVRQSETGQPVIFQHCRHE